MQHIQQKVILMDESQIFKSVEVLVAYFLPGILFSLLIIPELLSIGLFQQKDVSFSLEEYTMIGIIIGPLLRGCDSLLYKYILNYNILNHWLLIKYRRLRKKWSDVLSGSNKYNLFSELDGDTRNMGYYLESLADGYLWSSFILFIKFLFLLINSNTYLSLLTLSLSWIILYEGIDYVTDYIELISKNKKRIIE